MSTPNSPVSPILGAAIGDSSCSDNEQIVLSSGARVAGNNNYGTKTPSGNPRIYNCKTCQRAFTREEHLARHTLSTHNKLKPFTCGICSRPFSRRDLLLRHAKNLHQGSELAVSRIRKSYKRDNSGSVDKRARSASVGSVDLMSMKNSNPTSNSSRRTSKSYNHDDYTNNYNITTPPTPPATNVNTNNAPISTPMPMSMSMPVSQPVVTSITPSSSSSTSDGARPFQRRFKISVNMLVS